MQYNLVPVKGRWRSLVGKVTAGLVESNGSLAPGLWLCHLRDNSFDRDQLRSQRWVTFSFTFLTYSERQLEVHFHIITQITSVHNQWLHHTQPTSQPKHRYQFRTVNSDSTHVGYDTRHVQKAFKIRWPLSLTFWAQNWRIRYSWPGERSHHILFFFYGPSFSRQKPTQDRRTDGQNPWCGLLGRPHNHNKYMEKPANNMESR